MRTTNMRHSDITCRVRNRDVYTHQHACCVVVVVVCVVGFVTHAILDVYIHVITLKRMVMLEM